MRLSRLLLFAVATILVLATTAVATAARAPAENGTLSVRDGRAAILLRMKGGVIGRFARGRLTVTDADADADANTVVVRGAERERNLTERTTVYSGTKPIRFRISADRRIVVKIDGVKINFSAVGRGDVWLDGRGDPEDGVYFDGSYSRNGEDYKSLPDERERFELAAPPSSG